MGLFTVEKKEIEQLGSKDLVRVLKKLLSLEAKKFDIFQSAVSVTLNVNDPDGGGDGLIKWENGPQRTDWIPRRFTVFQSKAEEMGPQDCVNEILDKQEKIKPKVKEVLDAGGSYLFFCHKANSDQTIKNKIRKVMDVLINKGYPDTVNKQIGFYGGDQIAHWVNQYSPAQVYVMDLLGRHPIAGLQTWKKWNEKDGKTAYFLNDTINGWISQIRRAIHNDTNNAIRITGLSGLGKTRLALEALKPPEDESDHVQASISDLVIYYETGSDENTILRFITDHRDSADTIYVIDECNSALHSKLAGHVSSGDSNAKMITICNDPDNNQSADIERILLNPENIKDIVGDMLKNTYSGKLSDNDISKITDFAGGFPVIAVGLAKSRLRGGTTLELTDDNLVRRILWGQEGEDVQKMAILQACSIFKEFRLEDNDGNIHEQTKFICDVVTIDDNVKAKYDYFCSTIKEFAKRKIIQNYGRYYRIEPVPLALRLAKSWYESAIRGKIKTVIEEVESKGLMESFCEQARRFDCIPQAADLVEELCGPTCPFSNAEVVLSVAGSRIFRSFAEVNPKPVTDCLFRILTSSEVKAINIVDTVRRNLVRAFEKLCWHEETFEKAATMLKKLALAENESWSNNATGLFLQLFHIGLPGTLANLSQRQEIINDMINSDDIEQKKLAVKAIENVFQSGHFSRGGGVESQGTKAPEPDYYPTKKEEVEEYWKTNLELLTNLIISGGVVADEARKTFATISSSLIRHGYISDIEKSVNIILQTGIFWHAMLVKIENLLIRENNKFDEDVIERLKALSSSLEPQAWPDKIKHYITTPDWLHRKNKDGHYINLSDKKAEQLADELSESDELWSILPLIYEGEQRQGFTFGKRLASKLKDVSHFTKQSIVVLEKCKSPNILVLDGFLSGLDKNAVFMQVLLELAKSKKLVCFVPSLSQRGVATKEYFDFIIKLLEEHKLTVNDLSVLRYGTPLDSLSPKDAMSFCGDLSSFGTSGAGQALEILYMYCFGTPMRFDQCKEQFIAIISNNNLLSGGMDELDINTWSELVKQYIHESPAKFSENICMKLLDFCSSDVSDKLGSLRQLKDVTVELLKNMHEIVWPYFGNAILDKENWEVAFGISNLLKIECGDNKRTEESPLVQIPYDYLKNWCQKNVPEGPAAIMRLLPVVWEESADQYGIDKLSRHILIDFGSHKKVRDAATSQIFYFSSCGSREPYYLRRINILNELRKSTKNSLLKTWIDEITAGLMKEAKESKAEHDEFKAGIF